MGELLPNHPARYREKALPSSLSTPTLILSLPLSRSATFQHEPGEGGSSMISVISTASSMLADVWGGAHRPTCLGWAGAAR